MCIYIYIYVYRERERYIYIYIYTIICSAHAAPRGGGRTRFAIPRKRQMNKHV